MHLCGRIFLVVRFRPVFCPPILEHRGYAHEVQNAEQHLAMDPIFYMERCDWHYLSSTKGLGKLRAMTRSPMINFKVWPVAPKQPRCAVRKGTPCSRISVGSPSSHLHHVHHLDQLQGRDSHNKVERASYRQ